MTDRDRIIRYAIGQLKRMRCLRPTLSDVTVAIVKAKRLNAVWRGRYGIVSPTGMSYRVGLKLYYDIVRELNPAFHKQLLESGAMQRMTHTPKTKRSREVIREVRGYDIPPVRQPVQRKKQSQRGRSKKYLMPDVPVNYSGAFGTPPPPAKD